MMDFLKRVEVLQRTIEPKLQEVLKGYARKFEADLVCLIFKDNRRSMLNWGHLCQLEHEGENGLLEILRGAALKFTGTEPAWYTREEFLKINPGASPCKFASLAFIPLDGGEGEDAVLVLGFKSPPADPGKNIFRLGYEILGIYDQLLLKEALSSETDRKAYIKNFGKLLVEVLDYKQLGYLLESTLKPFLGYQHCTVFLLDNNTGKMNNLFFASESQLGIFPFKQSISIATLPVDDILDATHISTGQKTSLDFERLIESREVSPYLRIPEGEQGLESLLYHLYSGREVIGNCIFLFAEGCLPSSEIADLLDIIMDLISVALVKIVVIERNALQKEEMDVLQSLNTVITFNRDKNGLLKAINPKLKTLFNFAHQFVVGVNDDQLTLTGLLDDADSMLRFHKKYNDVVATRLPISDPIFTKVLLSNDPIVFDLDVLNSRQDLPDYMVMNLELGIKKIAMLSLRVGSKIIGIWAISLLANQHLTAYQLELMKIVSHQLSIAVENIRTTTVAEKKTLEREFLAKVSSDITCIRKREDLERLMEGNLKNYLLYDYAEVLLRNGNQIYTGFAPTIDTPELSPTDLTMTNAEKNFPFNSLMTGYSVKSFDFQKPSDSALHEYFRAEIDAGLTKKICIRLKKDNADVGFAVFSFTRQSVDSPENLELYKNLSAHLSIALSNILSYEEIERREQERELLLSLITEISAIRNPDQLVSTITSKLKTFLGFKHISIGTVTEDQKNVDVFLVDPESSARFHPEYGEVAASRFKINDGVIDKVLASAVPMVFNLEGLAEQIDLPAYLRINKESGIRQIVAMRFLREKLPFGTLVCFFEQDHPISSNKLTLIAGLGHQISIAVSNIIANKELERRNQEEARLVSLGYELRAVKDIKILWKTLGMRLKELFRIDNFLISVFNDNNKQHKILFKTPNSKFSLLEDFTTLTEDFQSVSEGVFGQIFTSDSPVLFGIDQNDDFENLGCLDLGPLPREFGMVGLVIKVGQQPLGFLLFEHHDLNWLCKRKQLFENIISQGAIVIANILSTQRIELQMQEINAFKQQLEQEKIYLTEEIDKIHNYNEIIGKSDALDHVFRLVSKVSASDSTVLILGETGTGKELIARAIHNNSPRKSKPMVKVNCAALPANLIESELFGHEKGSFTGATERRLGKFELANKGTLFLDEIGEMPIDLQVKLLRALQEKEIERVGGKETIKVDVRIIAATNRNLEKEIAEGRFRNDLFYRLNIFPISLPPLRHRKQDIEPLSLHFIRQFNKNCGKNIDSISARALETLMRYDWPGNIRELEHLIERSVLMQRGNVLNEVALPTPMEQLTVKAQFEEFSLKTIDENEKDYILKVLRYCRGRIAGNGGAAQILGVPPTTLNSKIKRLGIKREHISPDFNPSEGIRVINHDHEHAIHKN
ncbi:sigma-54-dependent Fis family transcriptional regulator [Pedobacter sp.]|uniref:sigma-54-dependent Fis family transcriptional regulator n=1 Tax=Pedobacter sp. TaxID=1411316 RepID=UPI003C6834D9